LVADRITWWNPAPEHWVAVGTSLLVREVASGTLGIHPREELMGLPNIGPLELGIVLLIVLVIFGPKRLPGIGRQLGTGMREFKDSITGKIKDDEDDERPALTQSSAEPERVAAAAGIDESASSKSS
jgi:sec-independent protein translocase protein TatA